VVYVHVCIRDVCACGGGGGVVVAVVVVGVDVAGVGVVFPSWVVVVYVGSVVYGFVVVRSCDVACGVG